jgi:hypothetical protein
MASFCGAGCHSGFQRDGIALDQIREAAIEASVEHDE